MPPLSDRQVLIRELQDLLSTLTPELALKQQSLAALEEELDDAGSERSSLISDVSNARFEVDQRRSRLRTIYQMYQDVLHHRYLDRSSRDPVKHFQPSIFARMFALDDKQFKARVGRDDTCRSLAGLTIVSMALTICLFSSGPHE
jgi:hypothetical protein